MTERLVEVIVGRPRVWVVVILALSVLALLPASRVHFDNSIEIWFLDDDPALALYNEFSEKFEADEIAIVAVFADDVLDPQVLSAIDGISTAAAELDFVDRVRSITNSALVRRLPLGFRDAGFPEEVMQSPALVGSLIAPNSSAAAIVVYYGRDGDAVVLNENFVQSLKAISEANTVGLDAEYLLTGSPVMGSKAQANNKADLRLLSPLMVLIIVGVSFVIFRNVWLTLLPLVVVAVAMLWTYALLELLGWPLTMISAMLTPLILAVGVADTIHVVGRFGQHIGKGLTRDAAVRASLGQLLRPCFFTSVTTMVGLLALQVSEIGPLRQFGVIAACGIFFAFLISITLVPALLVLVPAFRRVRPASTDGGVHGVLRRAIGLSGQHSGQLIFGALLVAVASGWFAQRISFGLDPLMWFPPGDPFRVATQRVDQAFGGSLTLEFMVTADANDLDDPARLRQLESFEAWLVENTVIERTTSVVTMIREAMRIAREGDETAYDLPRSPFLVDTFTDSLGRTGQLDGWLLPDFSAARISARIPVNSTRQAIEQQQVILADIESRFADTGLHVQMTGQGVLVGKMQDYVFRSQLLSFAAAFVAISALMFILLRSIALGIVAMLTNLVPLLVGLAVMSIAGIGLNPGTVMITAIALGIIIDDTVHFFTALKRQLQTSSDIAAATENAVLDVGRPIVITSILLTLGFAMMLFGSFLPSREIGGVTALIVLLALLADLVLLPAVIRRLPARALASFAR